jgi:tRNA(Ser,Leu) C12 N-acetylase TAN1
VRLPEGWNMVVTVREECFRSMRRVLGRLGTVGTTDFFNVLVLRTEDPTVALETLRAWIETEPGARGCIGHVAPVATTFTFQSAEEFEEEVRRALEPRLAQLAGKTFHVRLHRRGFKDRLSSHHAEAALGEWILEMLARAGTPASLSFDDTDVVVAIETLGQHAGLALRTRSDVARYPFLHTD